MNEEAKTGVYWAVAAAMAALAAFVAWPTKVETEESQQIGKLLFEKFTDPLAAASMKIVSFDADQSAISDFEVAKDGDGVWRIPTHGGYTADAETQMQKAATLFLDNTILDVATNNREDHPGFGVVDPTSNDVKVGSEGVGRLITIKDGKGTTMVSLIVGNEVEGQEGQRYVRRPGQDIVYAVDLDDTALTTKFTDWIEQDLLQLTPFDITGVTLKNYTASLDILQQSVQEEREFDAELTIDGSDWNLARLDTYKQGTSVPRPLSEDEQLNTQKLNELKRALDDLKIADVGRKPEGMSANLKASKDILSDQTALSSLLARGFIPAGRPGSDETEILAANGEIAVRMKDGVRYILRFGNVAGLSEQEQDQDAGEEDQLGMVGSNRYMLVTTEVDESIIPMPELQPVPQTIEELDAPAPAPEAAAAAEPDAAAQPPEMTDVPAPPAENPPAETPEPADSAEPSAPAEPAEPSEENQPSEEAPAADEAMTEEEPADEAGPELGDPAGEQAGEAADAAADDASGETTQQESGEGTASGGGQDAEAAQDGEASAADEPAQPSDEPPSDEAGSAEAPQDADTPTEPVVQETEQEKQERLEAAQERITKENQRKLDEREEKLEAARKHSEELNARFADWYYEISESTFNKLHLSIEDLIQSKDEQAGTPGAGQPQFNGLPGGLPPGFPGLPQQ